MTEPYAFTASVTVCVDLKQPESFLAKDPAYALAEALGVSIDWLPFIVAPVPAPVEAAAGASRGDRHRAFRSAYYERDLARYAKVRGVTIEGIYRNPDVTVASLGLLWARRRDPAVLRRYLDAVFEGYFARRLDIESQAALIGVLEKAGAETDGFGAFCDGDGPGELEALRASLQEAGVFTAPSFVVNGEIYVGREHLPMLRWQLTGRRGPGPI